MYFYGTFRNDEGKKTTKIWRETLPSHEIGVVVMIIREIVEQK